MEQSDVKTRELVIDDYDAAVALWQEEENVEICEGDSREEIRAYLERNPSLSRVAEVNGVLAGAVLCGHDGRRGFLYHLVVSPRYRGRGLGKLLLTECARGLHAAGIQRVIILVARDNSLGREFWLRNGWEELGDALPMARDV